MLNDLLTLTKIREGDIKAFEDVFRRYYSPLCWYAMSITGSMEAAEEIVEELFYGFWRDRERLPLFRSMKSYLYIAVRNQSFQYCEHLEVRNKYREFVLSRKGRTQDSSPQEEIEYQELRHLIDTTLARMPERRLRIFRMHRMEGKKYAEIASQLSLSVKTVVGGSGCYMGRNMCLFDCYLSKSGRIGRSPGFNYAGEHGAIYFGDHTRGWIYCLYGWGNLFAIS